MLNHLVNVGLTVIGRAITAPGDHLRRKQEAADDARFAAESAAQELRTELGQLRLDLGDVTSRHKKASNHIAEITKQLAEEKISSGRVNARNTTLTKEVSDLRAENLRLRTESAELKSNFTPSAIRVQIESATRAYKAEADAAKRSEVAAAEAMAVAVYGPDGLPIYDGTGVHGSYWSRLATVVEKQRGALMGMRAALGALLPWVDSVLRDASYKDTDVVLHGGQARGSVHNVVIRKSQIRTIREIYDATR